jgi:hypothetical protein
MDSGPSLADKGDPMQSVFQPAPFNVGDRVRYQGEMCLGGASPNDPVGHYDPNDYFLVPGIEATVITWCAY